MENIDFFKQNVDFYSTDYRDFSLKPWEQKIVNLVSGNVLDVACGGGRITIPMLANGCNVTATDFVREFKQKIMVHSDKFKGEFNFVESRMDKLPFDNNIFDCVTCINSIVYMEKSSIVHQAIYEMVRVLKPNGRIYITSWNMLHPLWGTSVVLNYFIRRRGNFGEVTPFFKMDSRANHRKVKLFVPSKKYLKVICDMQRLAGGVYNCDEFMGNDSIMSKFKPILVIAAVKKE